MATKTWNGSGVPAWSPSLPVDGDTLDVADATTMPLGANVPPAGTYALNISYAVTFTVSELLPAIHVCGTITLVAVASVVTVDRNWDGGNIGITSKMLISGTVMASANVGAYGTLELEQSAVLTINSGACTGLLIASTGSVVLNNDSVLNAGIYGDSVGAAITLGDNCVICGWIATDGMADNDITWIIGTGSSFIVDEAHQLEGIDLCFGEVTLTDLAIQISSDATSWLAITCASLVVDAGKTLTIASQGVSSDLRMAGGSVTLGIASRLVGLIYVEAACEITMDSNSVIQGLVANDGGQTVTWTAMPNSTGQRLIVDSLASRGFTLDLGGAATFLDVEVGTDTTGSNDASIRQLHIGGGAICDGKMQELTLATGIIMGAGTIHDWIGAAAYTAFGTIHGGLNDNITFRAHPQQVQPRRMGLALVG